MRDIDKRPMHIAAFLGLCFVGWSVGAFVANGISVNMGNVYAEATFSVLIGYWLGKAIVKYKQRDFASILAFPIINLIAGLLGYSLSYAVAPQSHGTKGLLTVGVAFCLSIALFAILNKKSDLKTQAVLPP